MSLRLYELNLTPLKLVLGARTELLGYGVNLYPMVMVDNFYMRSLPNERERDLGELLEFQRTNLRRMQNKVTFYVCIYAHLYTRTIYY